MEICSIFATDWHCIFMPFSNFLVERTCGPEEWACKSKSGQCIPNAWVCDDHEDCDDKSDEEVCSKYN